MSLSVLVWDYRHIFHNLIWTSSSRKTENTILIVFSWCWCIIKLKKFIKLQLIRHLLMLMERLLLILASTALACRNFFSSMNVKVTKVFWVYFDVNDSRVCPSQTFLKIMVCFVSSSVFLFITISKHSCTLRASSLPSPSFLCYIVCLMQFTTIRI